MDVGVDAYASIAEVSAYLLARGTDSSWLAAIPAKQSAAIVEATSFLDASFTWVGRLEDCDQTLGWPRVCAWDKEGRRLEGIPTQVKNATAELANLALGGRLMSMSLASSSTAIKSERIGDVQVDYSDEASDASYDYVTLLLRGLCINSNSKKLIRA